MIKGMIDDNSSEEEIPLPNITSVTLKKIIEFLEHIHAGNPAPDIEKPLRSNNLEDVTTEFYAKFIELPDDTV